MSNYSDKVKRRAREQNAVSPIPREPQKPETMPVINSLPITNASAKHFCAGVLYKKRGDGVWCVAGITDKRFPDDVRIPGGTNKNAAWEQPLQTLCRELGEELLVTMCPESCCSQVHSVSKHDHTQFFFVVRLWSGDLREGWFQDSDREELFARWIPLAEFWHKCFRNHREGFQKAVAKIADEKQAAEPEFFGQAIQAGIISAVQ